MINDLNQLFLLESNSVSGNEDKDKIPIYEDFRFSEKNFKEAKQAHEQIIMPNIEYNILVTEEVFHQLQNNKALTNDYIKKHYSEYRNNFMEKIYLSFFNEYKSEKWFEDKYGIKRLFIKKNNQKIQCQKLSEAFNELLKNNNFLTLDLGYNEEFLSNNLKSNKNLQNELNKLKILERAYNEAENKYEDSNRNKAFLAYLFNKEFLKNSNDELDLSQAPFFAIDPDLNTLYLNTIPANVFISDIFDHFKKLQGFLSLSVSEPNALQGFNRLGWVLFNSIENFQKALEINPFDITIEDVTIPFKKSISNRSGNKLIRITPDIYIERLKEDYDNTERIIDLLNKIKMLKVTIKLYYYQLN